MKTRLLRRLHHHAGSVLRIQRLVLDGDGIDVYALRLHALQVLDEVASIGIVVFRLQCAALGIVVGLHPRRRGPRRGEYFDLGIELQNLFHHRDHVLAVRPQAEVRHLRIRLALGHVVVGEDALVQIRCADGQTQVADADAGAGGVEQLFQDGRPVFRVHADQVLRAASGQCVSETIDGLELLLFVHVDGGIPVAGRGERQRRLLPFEQGGLIRIGQPDLRVAAFLPARRKRSERQPCDHETDCASYVHCGLLDAYRPAKQVRTAYSELRAGMNKVLRSLPPNTSCVGRSGTSMVSIRRPDGSYTQIFPAAM